MSTYNLAQLNISRMIAPLDSPVLADFVAQLAAVNVLAERAPGFVWRLQTEDGDATAIRPYGDDRLLVNMSVWESAEALHAYVYRSGHVDVLRRRREWFARPTEAAVVLWWIPSGHRPTLTEGLERLEELKARGAAPRAFTFRALFPPPDVASADHATLPDACPAS